VGRSPSRGVPSWGNEGNENLCSPPRCSRPPSKRRSLPPSKPSRWGRGLFSFVWGFFVFLRVFFVYAFVNVALSCSPMKWPCPKASALAAIASLPADNTGNFPRCQRFASCRSVCWKINPCLGGLAPVFSERKSAFSAPKTWMVLAGRIAKFCKPAGDCNHTAPKSAPATARMLGASSSIVAVNVVFHAFT